MNLAHLSVRPFLGWVLTLFLEEQLNAGVAHTISDNFNLFGKESILGTSGVDGIVVLGWRIFCL